MKTKMGYSLLVIFLLAGITLQSQQLKKKNNRWILESTKSFSVASGGAIKMEEIRGDVTIKSWDKTEVKINAIHYFDVFTESEAKALAEKFQTQYEKQENTIIIQGEGFYKKSVNSDYDILVPKQFQCQIGLKGGDLSITDIDGKIETNVGGGDVKITNILGPLVMNVGGGDVEILNCQKNVNINIGGGDIEMRQIQGAIQMQVGGGDVAIEDSEGPVNLNLGGGDLEINCIRQDVTAQVGGGDVEMQNIDGFLKCEIGGGGIEVKNIMGGMDIQAGGGEIEAIYTKDTINASASILLQSNHGDIELTLPGTIKATIVAEIEKMHRQSDEMIDSDFPLEISVDKNWEKRITAKGTINGGGVKFNLKTQGGDISINEGEDE